MNLIKNLFLTFISTLVLLALAEVGVRMILGHPLETSGFNQRVMLFEATPNFKNENEIFKYHSNSEFRSATFYVNPDQNKAVKEYDLVMKTNNLGLIQLNDIKPGALVDAFIGDSFTEGQGATPWFYQLEKERNELTQVINAGIIGTGPLQWLVLINHLQDKYGLEYRKPTVILIAQDISRPVWNFAEHYIICLNTGVCKKRTHPWYGYNFDGASEADVEKFAVEKYLSVNSLTAPKSEPVSSDYVVHKLIQKSAFAFYVHAIFNEFIITRNTSKDGDSGRFNSLESKNLNAIKDLVNIGTVQGKILLIPEKREAKTFSVQLEPNTQKILDWFSENNLTFDICSSLRTKDFHINDGHPNEMGYIKIKRCVEKLQ